MNIHRVKSGSEALWRKAVHTLVAEEDRCGKLASISDLIHAFSDSRCYFFLASLDSNPVGLLSAYRFPDVEAGGYLVYLYDIEVDKAHRRQGTGAALVRALVEQCRADGVQRIWAGTSLDNVAARRTFETTGAALEGETYAEYEWEIGAGQISLG